MATIETFNANDSQALEKYKQHLDSMPEGSLIAQEIAQQAIIHALGHLLKSGCTKKNATEMMDCLRWQAELVAKKITERGFKQAFNKDQTGFH